MLVYTKTNALQLSGQLQQDDEDDSAQEDEDDITEIVVGPS
jgi:hypothetical protein